MPRPRREKPKRPGRANPPPEVTGQEKDFFGSAVKSGALLTVFLCDGEQLRGTVAGADRNVIQLQPDEGAVRVLPKAEIRFISE